MTIFQAVEKSIEGGYSREVFVGKSPEEKARIIGDMVLPEVLLDHRFWQSLGKAMGWGITRCGHDAGMTGMMSDINTARGDERYWGVCNKCESTTRRTSDYSYEDDWKKMWHRFIDHLAEGKDAESFFESL